MLLSPNSLGDKSVTKKYNQQLLNDFSSFEQQWDKKIIPTLKKYITIPSKSPMFDKDWKANGYMDQAMKLLVDWCQQQSIKDMRLELCEADGRTPLLFIEIPGQIDDTILLYGHMDKQPEMKGWDDDLGPWKPVIKNNKLYGRGGADDGYSVFSSLSAIAWLQKHNIPHARCVVIIEGCEESGSVDLPYYVEKLRARIDMPSLIICLDSETGNYEQLWSNTSIRGLIGGTLKIEVLTEGLHSGYSGGVVPTTFSILRELLNRVEDSKTGDILIDELHVDIPPHRHKEAQITADCLGNEFYKSFPFVDNTKPLSTNVAELLLNRSWRPSLVITGANGLPEIENAGNVMLPKLEAKLSIRLPPTCNIEKAIHALKNTLEKNPPYHAKIEYRSEDMGSGWDAPKTDEWLNNAIDNASMAFYNKPSAYIGVGGSIPFMGMLGEMFPKAQFFITGVLGPKSNAHGPNEFLHIPMVKKLTGCIASIIAAHGEKEIVL